MKIKRSLLTKMARNVNKMLYARFNGTFDCIPLNEACIAIKSAFEVEMQSALSKGIINEPIDIYPVDVDGSLFQILMYCGDEVSEYVNMANVDHFRLYYYWYNRHNGHYELSCRLTI